MSRRKILVVDDEPKLVRVVREYLEHDGYRVVSAGDGRVALERFRQERPDLVVLDVMLPELDGLEVCRRIRRDSAVPIIMLTARAEEVDELIGLELGADDYVAKPFSPRTLLARVRSVLRRAVPAEEYGAEGASEAPLSVGPLRVDPSRHEATWDGVPLALTPTEFRLLSALARRPGRVFGRLELLERIQGEAYAGYERTVDAHVKNLRKKLAGAGGDGAAESVATVPGVGYKLEAGRA
ncbi:response regulator (plasmid) [Rubrobacter tropicus]|uniref:Response regulator n=1 Tax=Rubrobacter tropicus TaxID=2653851 RepID=A0A6G8QGM8_9ACTN|nr:response regulator transcription factor [Rubrobacter tropicus]QIN85377.1 response regulator [Rubrobacter tropicus]